MGRGRGRLCINKDSIDRKVNRFQKTGILCEISMYLGAPAFWYGFRGLFFTEGDGRERGQRILGIYIVIVRSAQGLIDTK